MNLTDSPTHAKPSSKQRGDLHLAFGRRPSTRRSDRLRQPEDKTTGLQLLVGSGDKIGLLALPWLTVGLALNVLHPAWFSVGGPPAILKILSTILLIPGIVTWAWSVVLILTRVPKGELITDGPYALVKHPLYTGVALLVAPWAGFLLDSWLGVPIGVTLYMGSRAFSPEEEEIFSKTFGDSWDAYCKKVKLPWL